MAIGKSTMKNGWCKTWKNTVHCYQTPFDIALIFRADVEVKFHANR